MNLKNKKVGKMSFFLRSMMRLELCRSVTYTAFSFFGGLSPALFMCLSASDAFLHSTGAHMSFSNCPALGRRHWSAVFFLGVLIAYTRFYLTFYG